MLMDLKKAIEILKVNKGIAETDLDMGYSNDGNKEFAEAVGVVLDFLENTQEEAK
jgi:adenine-specific DNA methylase